MNSTQRLERVGKRFFAKLFNINGRMPTSSDPIKEFADMMALFRSIIQVSPNMPNSSYTLRNGISGRTMLGSCVLTCNILHSLNLKLDVNDLNEEFLRNLITLRDYAHSFPQLTYRVLDWSRLRDADYYEKVLQDIGRLITHLITRYEKQALWMFENLKTPRLQRVHNVWDLLPDPEHPEKCPVCYGVTLGRGSEFAILQNCSHTFCVTCATKWFENKTTCPMCRKEGVWMTSTKFLRIREQQSLNN